MDPRRTGWLYAVGLGVLLLAPPPGLAAPQVVTDSGDITDGVNSFRAALGDPQNGGTPGEQAAGRREINWDGVPAAVTNVDTFPAAFFNTNSTRGSVYSPANGFRVSDNDFSDINPNYLDEFAAFSPIKTFMVVGGNTMEVLFQVAGATTPAAISGFGVVFSDVDVAGSARLELFRGAQSLGVWEAPVRSDAGGLSFLGVTFDDDTLITRVRITSGQGALGPAVQDVSDGGALDLVVMDDFLYGEPHADSDLDGVVNAEDEVAGSDTRAKVDLNGNAAGQTPLDNRTLASGATIQDLVLECQQDSTSLASYRRCLRRLANRLRASREITANEHAQFLRLAGRVRLD